MPKWLTFLMRRIIAIPITMVIVTALLYGVAMLVPAELRAKLYWPPGMSEPAMEITMGTEEVREMNRRIVEQYGLDDPYPVQYSRWLFLLIQGDWGSSFAVGDVLAAILQRTSATAELTIYSVLLLIPLGLAGGVLAGERRGRLPDIGVRMIAFAATSIPPFILGFILLGLFYVTVNWFPPGRLGVQSYLDSSFHSITGLLTIDGLLNGRADISLDALRHLVMPVFTLTLVHWATLVRVTRSAMIEELDQPYVATALGKGLSRREAVWRHALRNAILPGLNSSAVSVASLLTGVFVVESIFTINGVSGLFALAVANIDLPLTMGLVIYSALVVVPLMLVLDIVQAIVDPRVREGVL